MKRAWGNSTDNVLAALRDIGPLTSIQLQELLGIGKCAISPVLTRLRTGKTGAAENAPKRIYIRRWLSGLPGKKNHLRPEFALGDLPDEPKPAPKSARQINADYRRNKALRATVAALDIVTIDCRHGLLPHQRAAGGGATREAPAKAAAAS